MHVVSLPPPHPLFAVSLGYYSHPKRNRRQWVCKKLDVNKRHYGLCENGKLGTLIKNDNDCNENMNNTRFLDYLKLLLAVRAIIVHVLDKTSLCKQYHVVVARRTLRNIPESAMHVQCCLFLPFRPVTNRTNDF